MTCDRSVVSSTMKTDRHDITEIMLKVSLNTINPNQINDIETCKNILSSIFVYTGCRTCKDIDVRNKSSIQYINIRR